MEAMKPAPEEVSNAFVNQYYNILSHSPNHVHKFYQDASTISRPSSDGLPSSASTLDGIDNLILSLDYKHCLIEILTIDAQDSLGNGVIVLVTGYLTGKENIRRKFTQIFFLAPQGNGSFYVLNDVFRYVDEDYVPALESSETDDMASTDPVTPDPEPNVIPNHSVLDDKTTPLEDTEKLDESIPPIENGMILPDEKEAVSGNILDASVDDGSLVSDGVDGNDNDHHAVTEAAASDVQEDAPKKSYASVANALNFKKQPFQQRVLPPKPGQQASTPAARESSRSVNSNPVEKNNNLIVKGYSVFVANLPMDATEEQLREVFEKFGPIKSNGVQVRSAKQEKNCFGFVEFESADSMQSAVKAASIIIGNRRAHIEEKKANGDGRKKPPRRGGFRNGGGRSYGRIDSENQGGFPRQGRGTNLRNGEANHTVHQNGGKVPRQSVQGQGVKN
ncbi:hypothetical protein K2173_015074 [Erythroxylum novogranatense]|uniref:Uncharacterized protein n=1 Tax=Erythroxylum novogranatense TaxID=1862640 RepID=A0AAV8T0X3_9ROSI|nr:hypothetical protein K2173_015074 [Erythroxylum novogranatense]